MPEYVTIAPGVEGYAFVDPKTNELVTLDSDQLGTDQINLVPATPADIEGARKGFAAQGGGQKTLGLLEAAASGATFGLTSQTGPRGLALPGSEARSQVLQQENPILEGTARVAGTMLPALAAGGAGAAALGARGLAGRAAAFVAEDLTQAAAYEVSEATQQDRDIDVGNVAQGLLEGAAFLGLAHGAARGFRAVRNAGRGAEEVATGALKEADATSTLARTREQAAARETAERATPTRNEAKHYAENEAEIRGDVNDLAYQTGNSAFGREGSFSQAHSIQYKKQDIAGKMTDANIDRVDEVLEAQADALESLAAKIEDKAHTSAPSGAAARSIRQQAQEIRRARAAAQLEGAGIGSAGGVEDAAIAADRAKRHLDDLRERFGSHATKSTDPLRNNVKMIDEVLDGAEGAGGLRQHLEDAKIWGKTWAQKQAEENKLWSGKNGIIESRAIWQHELMERAPGAAGTYRTPFGSLPVFQMKDGMVENLLSLGPNKRRQVMQAMQDDLTKTEAMTQIKAAIGGEQARPALDAIRRDVADLKGVLAEAQRIAKIEATHGAYLAKQRKLGNVSLEDALESLPGGKIPSVATRGLKKVLNERFTPAQAEAQAMKASELRAKIEARRAAAQGAPRKATTASAAVDRARARAKQSGHVSLSSREPVTRIEQLKAVKEESNRLWGSLTPDERDAINAYTESSTRANRQLAGAETADESMDALLRAVDKLAVDQPTRFGPLYRGTRLSEAEVSDMRPGKAVTLDRRLASATYFEQKAKDFSQVEHITRSEAGENTPVLFKIEHADRGTPKFGDDLGGGGTDRTKPRGPDGRRPEKRSGALDKEAEVLLDGRTKYEVTAVEKKDGVTVVTLGRRPASTEGSVTLNPSGPNFSLGDVAKSPMGVVTGAGAVALGAKELIEPEEQAAEIAAVAEETRAIRELDQHSKAATERSMLQLSGAPVDQPPLPSVRERFQGDHANITDAYRANMSRLTQLTNDPMKFVEQSTAAFAGMAQAGHPELAAKLITRLQVGAQYLLANQPPALASSMFEPEGSPVDEVAVLQFAPLWEAVWHPLDTVRDIGARNAPPSAVKALREVHPDVYQRAMTETFRTLAQAGPSVSFETKRYLDNVFGYGAAVGRSFSPAMSNLLASERLNNQPTQRSLGGESVLAPESASSMFSKGPSALRTGT